MSTKDNARAAGNSSGAKQHQRTQCTGSPADRLLSRLERVRQSGAQRWMARCPAHADRTASLSIRECDDGRILINDFGGCGADAIVKAAGLELSDLFTERPPVDGQSRRTPPFPWRDFARHSRTALTAICLALRDLAAGRPITETDAEFLRRTAADLLSILDSIESAEGRR